MEKAGGTDFIKDKYIKNIKYNNDSEFPFEFMTDLWGEQIEVHIHSYVDDEYDDDYDKLLNLIFPSIQKIITFVNEQRCEIEQAMIDDDNVGLANDWAESAESYKEDENSYIMKDGQKVKLPITEEDFRKNISIDEAEISFLDSLEDISIELFIKYNPDIFAGHVLRVEINKDNEIACHGLAG